ncbi:hypothetical protein ACX3V1_32450 [Escherichia coli]
MPCYACKGGGPPLYKPTTAYEILRCLVGSEMCIRDSQCIRSSRDP